MEQILQLESMLIFIIFFSINKILILFFSMLYLFLIEGCDVSNFILFFFHHLNRKPKIAQSSYQNREILVTGETNSQKSAIT